MKLTTKEKKNIYEKLSYQIDNFEKIVEENFEKFLKRIEYKSNDVIDVIISIVEKFNSYERFEAINYERNNFKKQIEEERNNNNNLFLMSQFNGIN